MISTLVPPVSARVVFFLEITSMHIDVLIVYARKKMSAAIGSSSVGATGQNSVAATGFSYYSNKTHPEFGFF